MEGVGAMSMGLEEEGVRVVLDRMHRRAARDWLVFAQAVPAVLFGFLRGRGAVESAKPYLKNAAIPIDRDQGLLLYQLVRATRPETIVEFGTSFGLSATYMAAALRDNGGGRFFGSEMEPTKLEIARRNLDDAGLLPFAEILAGDALKTLPAIGRPIDLLFLDGWKELTLDVLKALQTFLRPGALVICDDINGFKKTLTPYLDYVGETRNGYHARTLNIGDGFSIAVRL